MSFTKITSLKLVRKNENTIKVEDTSMLLAEETKTHVERIENSAKCCESSTPLHSTPKRSSGKSKNTQEAPGLECRGSPILPCTQDGGNEVAWDWQGSLRKTTVKRNRNNAEPSGTPKRPTLLQKKRNSNSPLLYKPIKRKLLKNDNKESLDKFTAELKALSEQMRTVNRDEGNNVNGTDDERTHGSVDELLVQIDEERLAGCQSDLEVTISDDNSSRKSGEAIIAKTSLEDLFDDSIEDSMVRCSQEVEEKLHLASRRENASSTNSTNNSSNKSFSWHLQSYSRSPTTNDKSVGSSKNSSSLGSSINSKNSVPCKVPTSTKENGTSNPATTTTTTRGSGSNLITAKSLNFNNNAKESSKTAFESGRTTTRNAVYEIPDDSFDDLLADCFDDVENVSNEKNGHENNQSTRRYGKVYVSPHSGQPNDNSRKPEASAVQKVLFPPPSQNSSSKGNSNSRTNGTASKYFPRSSSNDTLKSISNAAAVPAPPSQTVAGTNQARKFFKLKSLSDSSFDDKTSSSRTNSTALNSKTVCKGNSNVSLSSKGWKAYANTPSSVSTQRQQIQRGNSYQDNAYSSVKGNERNPGIYNVDRSAPKEDDNIRFNKDNKQQTKRDGRDVATGSQVTQICTPEEIERKRLEAKMKLEAKRKLLARSSSAGTLSGGTVQRPVKR